MSHRWNRRKALCYIFIVLMCIALVICVVISIWSRSQLRKPAFLYDKTFRISAHRGAQYVAPENTLEAIDIAARLQYGAIELDPRRSLDGVIYLMHDNDVLRTTNGNGIIEEMTSEVIDKLIINIDGFPSYNNEVLRIPRLEQAVKIISGKKIVLNIDCSKGNWNDRQYVDEVMTLLQKYNMDNWVFFVITDEETRNNIHNWYPALCLSWLFRPEIETIDQYIDTAHQLGDNVILSVKNEYADQTIIDKLIKSGYSFQIYNVNDSARREELEKAGVPMIETDYLIP